MKDCAFTIVAKNYIGLALILQESLRCHNPQVDFRIFVADHPANKGESLPSNIGFIDQLPFYSAQELEQMAFKYDLTEFCTAVKPCCFKQLFSEGYERVMYFDPDVFVFSPIDEILQRLETYAMVLTPQVIGVHPHYNGEHPEWAMNVNGIFNLGFCGMRKCTQTEQIADWWDIRLRDGAFTDRSVGNFTDQKWMDWMPALLGNEGLYVMRHLGMNMAPWNFFERELFIHDESIYVRFRTNDNQQRQDPLVFLHFAGYDYQQLMEGKVVRKRIENLKEYDDLALASYVYMKAFQQSKDLFLQYIELPYSYATFNNGDEIQSFHRRLYHGLLTEGTAEEHPFACGKNTFHHRLLKKGMITQEKIDRLTQRNMPDIAKKRRMIGRLFGMLYRLMGYKRYSLFVKSLYQYCRPELHTFLIHKKHEKDTAHT